MEVIKLSQLCLFEARMNTTIYILCYFMNDSSLFAEMTSKNEGVFDWAFACQELIREQGVDVTSAMSDARLVDLAETCGLV